MPVEIPLTHGYVALVDESDAAWISSYSWSVQIDPRGLCYAIRKSSRSIGRKTVRMHRQIMDASPGTLVDHWDHDGLNNQRLNLRAANHSQNSANRRMDRAKARSKFGYIGVVQPKRSIVWYGCVRSNSVIYYTAGFRAPEEAARARDELALKYHGEFASLNFPVSVAA